MDLISHRCHCFYHSYSRNFVGSQKSYSVYLLAGWGDVANKTPGKEFSNISAARVFVLPAESGSCMLIPKLGEPRFSHSRHPHIFSELKELPRPLPSLFLTGRGSSGKVLWNPLLGRYPRLFIVQKGEDEVSVSRDPDTPRLLLLFLPCFRVGARVTLYP